MARPTRPAGPGARQGRDEQVRSASSTAPRVPASSAQARRPREDAAHRAVARGATKPAAASELDRDAPHGGTPSPWLSTSRPATARRPSGSAPSKPLDTVSMRLNERLRERKRTHRRALAIKSLRLIAVGSVVVGAIWAILASPVFSLDVSKIEVKGLAPEIDSAAVSTILNAREGDSLALLNVAHVQDQLEDIPGVRDAKVERVWPSGLRVTLVARHPVAAIPQQQGFIVVDADAVTVGRVDTAPPGLPVMTVPVGDERVLEAVLEVIKNLPASTLARVTTIGAQTEDTVSFTLADGPRVDWGGPEDSALKAQVLDAMLVSGAAAGAAVVDVSAPTLPITKSQG